MKPFKLALQKEGIGVSIECSLALQPIVSNDVFIAVESNDSQIKETELHYIHKGIAKVHPTIVASQYSYILLIENCQWDLADYSPVFWELAIVTFLCNELMITIPIYNLSVDYQSRGAKLSFEWA